MVTQGAEKGDEMRRLALLVGMAILGTVGNSGISSAQAVDHNVLILGGPTIIPGESLTNNWRFEDRNIVVNPGDIVAWDNTGPDEDAPHTITLVRQSKLPANLREMQECLYDRGQPCRSALHRHGTSRPRSISSATSPGNLKKILEDDKDNEHGLDEPRDSRWIRQQHYVRVHISAAPGTTLYYLCALHPWMQGSIEVVAP
jgi:plastocyanin